MNDFISRFQPTPIRLFRPLFERLEIYHHVEKAWPFHQIAASAQSENNRSREWLRNKLALNIMACQRSVAEFTNSLLLIFNHSGAYCYKYLSQYHHDIAAPFIERSITILSVIFIIIKLSVNEKIITLYFDSRWNCNTVDLLYIQNFLPENDVTDDVMKVSNVRHKWK